MVMFDVYKRGLQLHKKCAHTDLIVTKCNFKWVTIKLIILCAKSVTKTIPVIKTIIQNNTLSCSQFNPQNAENHILGLFSGEACPQTS